MIEKKQITIWPSCFKNQFMTSDDFSVKPILSVIVTYFNTSRFCGQRSSIKNHIYNAVATSGLNMLTSVYAHRNFFYCYFP